jgi:OHCU decarboxylase
LTGLADPLTLWNAMSTEEAEAAMLACCGSQRWARRMAQARPFDEDRLFGTADRIWRELPTEDWHEAFAAHPRIGARASGQAAAEQADARGASPETLAALARANREYEERFGYIFIVCASGRSAEEMLDLCRRRLHNAPAEELKMAAEEQRKITRLRLEKWLSSL